MSDKKRRRISAPQEGNTIELVETIQKPKQEEVKEVKEETQDPHAEFYNEAGEFLWDAYEATCVTRTRKPNPHIKTKHGDKVYSREPYAQELYDILSEHSPEIKPSLNIGEIHTGVIYAMDQEWITVDIGYRESVYVKASKESEEVRMMIPGDETAVLITETKGTLSGSITGGVKQKTFMDLRDSIEEGNTAKAIKKIVSLSFFEDNILTDIYLPDLMAVKSWDPDTNKVVYDKNIYNTKTNAWVRNYSYPHKQIPSAQESYEEFIEEHLSLSEDKKSGFITISIKHQSPYLAKQWAELIVNEVDNFYRIKDKLESEKAVNYLNKQISMTSISEIQKVLAELLQEETQKLTLIEANQFYVFEYIDPPAVMEEKSSPKRALIFILTTILGGILGILSVLIMHYIFGKETK